VIAFVQYGVAGVLEHYVSRPIDASGDGVTDPTCTLLWPSGSEMQAEDDCDVGPTSSLGAAAAAGTYDLTVTDTTDMAVGDVLWLTNSDGQSEPIIAHAVTPSTEGEGEGGGEDGEVESRHELEYSYAEDDVIASRRLRIDVLAASMTTCSRDCRARWTYQSGGVTYSEETVFHVSRYAPRCTVTEADVLRRHPQARQWVAPRQPLGDLVEEIWRREVLTDLSAIYTPTAIISGEALHTATILRVAAQLALNNGQLELYDRWHAEYRGALDQAVSVSPVDTDDDGSSDDEQRYSARVVRLLRG
jgi:hypothetical protein